MVKILEYHEDLKQDWDGLVSRSRNGTFLHHRDYLEYHSDRFTDTSLMFYSGSSLIGVLPGNGCEAEYHSHGGLTYGGVIITERMSTIKMVGIFDVLRSYLEEKGYRRLIYKAVPHIYHTRPSEEDAYVLFMNNASLVKRQVSSAIYLKDFSYPGKRNRGALKALRSGLTLEPSTDFDTFFEIVNQRLGEQHGVEAVHTPDEMRLLQGRFPENIKLIGAYLEEEMVAGALVYITKTCVHLQYLTTTETGRKLRAPDLLIRHLTIEEFPSWRWFDLGHSTEKDSRVLNNGLINQKEEFGASAVNYDTYLWEISG